jgi:hypothetical protein
MFADFDLIIADPHTTNFRVFWRGKELQNIKAIHVDSYALKQRVILTLYLPAEEAEMTSRGVVVRSV